MIYGQEKYFESSQNCMSHRQVHFELTSLGEVADTVCLPLVLIETTFPLPHYSQHHHHNKLLSWLSSLPGIYNVTHLTERD